MANTLAAQVSQIYNANWCFKYTTDEALAEYLKKSAEYGNYVFVIDCQHLRQSDINDLFDRMGDQGFQVSFYNGSDDMIELAI